MKLVNATPHQAALLRTDVGAGDVLGVAIVKSTFDFDDRGATAPAAEPMPLVKQFLETPFGFFHDEHFFKKQGVDLCVLGHVRRSKPVYEARVRMTWGPRRWELLVLGDRRWQRNHGTQQLVPSRPAAFTEIPLGYSHAFGGEVKVGELAYAYPGNPKGRGFYRTLQEAENQPVHNIDDPRQAPATWRPAELRPAGWGPYANFWALRGAAAIVQDPKTHQIVNVQPSLFNHAHPDLILDRVEAGQEITIEGMQEGTIRLAVPAPPTRLDLSVGAESRELEAPIDGIFLWTDSRKLVVTQRARFRYPIRAHELRTVHVQATPH
ncbi:MAG TPA: DUF2169 domain-containing protein [Polyangia bacterium]|nr:DUF2169 domain-containing protein [Polyangia bacterium]